MKKTNYNSEEKAVIAKDDEWREEMEQQTASRIH
jgi:hypothetical protein